MARIEYAAPGAAVLPHRGDLLLTHDPHSLVCKLIRGAQHVRFRGSDREFAYWNHVACVVDDAGGLIEAKGRAHVRRVHISEYESRWYAICHVDPSPADAEQMVRYAEHALGEPYNYLGILFLLGWVLTGGHLAIGLDGTEFCSQLAANFVARAGAIFPRGAIQTMPADVAKKYGVPAPLS